MVRYLFYTIGDLTYQSPLVHYQSIEQTLHFRILSWWRHVVNLVPNTVAAWLLSCFSGCTSSIHCRQRQDCAGELQLPVNHELHTEVFGCICVHRDNQRL